MPTRHHEHPTSAAFPGRHAPPESGGGHRNLGAAGASGNLPGIAAAFVAGFLALLPLRGEQTRPTTIEELASRADAIVHGTVSSLECRRDAEGHLFTRVELDVTASWKGAATNRFTLTLAGGVLGSRRVVVVGQPEFRVGEEVVVFAGRNARGELLLLDLGQGKFSVTRDPVSGATSARNPVFGAPENDMGKAAYRPPTQLPLSLEQLRQRVKDALATSIRSRS